MVGHRACYAVIEDRTPAFYYSHWGALTTPQVVLAGPEETITYIRHLESHTGLLDNRWAEGGILIDLDSRVLMFYGGQAIRYTPYLRRLLLRLLQRVWSGWTVEYIRFGMVDFARHLGIDSANVLTTDRQGGAREITLDELHAAHPAEFECSLATATWPDGTVSDYRFAYEARAIAALGSGLLSALQQRAPVAFPHEGEESEYGVNLDSGVYIDAPKKTIWVWDDSELDPRWLEDIGYAWPGWHVEGHIDGVVRQALLSGRDPTPFMVPDAEAAQKLMAILSSGWSVDPGALLKSALSNPPAGADRVEIASGFLRNDPPPMPPEDRRNLLEQLIQDVLG